MLYPFEFTVLIAQDLTILLSEAGFNHHGVEHLIAHPPQGVMWIKSKGLVYYFKEREGVYQPVISLSFPWLSRFSCRAIISAAPGPIFVRRVVEFMKDNVPIRKRMALRK